jgi:DNA gyrase/topoisomerase IV subunit A
MALVDGIPTLLNLKEYIKVYVEHNINCLIKEYRFELDKAEKRLEIVDGLIRAISIIDEIIKTIKASKSSDEARTNLINLYSFTANQAKAIVDMRLGKLANLEITELNKEQVELNKIINKCNKFLASKNLQKKEFLNRLSNFVDKYGWTRRTEVIDIDLDVEKTMLKKHEEKKVENFVIALTKGNTIKRMTLNDANKKQKLLTEEDTITHTVELSLKDRFVLISNTGTMYKLNVNKIDLCNINSTGMNLYELFNEKIVGIYTEDEQIPFLIFVTKNGLIKKIKTNLVVKLSKVVGAPIMKVLEDDEIIECKLATDEDTIILNNGKKDKEIKIKDLVDKGRGAGGVVGVKPLKNCVCTVNSK